MLRQGGLCSCSLKKTGVGNLTNNASCNLGGKKNVNDQQTLLTIK